jgi:iron complex transport system substrate-binding protein
LSRYSRDRSQSFAANDAQRYPILSGGAEDVLVLRPDIVVAGLFDKRSTRELLKDKGLRLAEFGVPRNLDEVKAQIRQMGEIVQHVDRATAQIARLDAAVARASQAVTEKHYSVLPLSRRGWVSGRDSLVSSLLTETGLFNAAGDLGVGSGGYASLEAIVNAKPDFLLVSEEGSRAEDDGRAFLLHPALERFYPLARRIVIPERLTVCGGVMLADALDVLVAELKRVRR